MEINTRPTKTHQARPLRWKSHGLSGGLASARSRDSGNVGSMFVSWSDICPHMLPRVSDRVHWTEVFTSFRLDLCRPHFSIIITTYNAGPGQQGGEFLQEGEPCAISLPHAANRLMHVRVQGQQLTFLAVVVGSSIRLHSRRGTIPSVANSLLFWRLW